MVSPHRDDAAFSCGIAIQYLTGYFSICVANCFTVSEYAPFRNVEAGTVSELRRREDQAFARFSQARLEDLNLIDAPERLNIGVSEISSSRPLDDRDSVPRAAIKEHVRSLAPDLVMLPLAIGDHIDHRIAQAGAIDAGEPGLAFYEDLPYCARAPEDAPSVRASELNLGLFPLRIGFEGAEEWKRQCASLYPSQIDGKTVSEIAHFSNRYSGGERFWVTERAAELFRLVLPA